MSRLADRVRLAARAVQGIFNERSLTQAFGLLPGVLPGTAGIPPTRGTADYLRAYSQMPWLRAVTSRIATAVARVEWQLFVAKGPSSNGKAIRRPDIQRADRLHRHAMMRKAAETDNLKQIVTHPLLDVLSNANEFQTGYALRKITQLHVDLVGDAFWLKERDAQGVVTGVWPVQPHWIAQTPTPNFRFFRVSFRAWRGLIPDTEWIWFSDPDPLNPYGRGTGAAMALGDELETDEYAARHTKAFFYNSARPDILVWPKGPATNQAQVDRLEEDWTAKSQGFWKAWKPYFLTREVEVKTLDQNFRSAQLVQLREFERNLVLQHFGVPPEVLGVLDHSNRSTIDAADYLMARYVLEPRLEFLRSVLQERFVPEFDERLIIDYIPPAGEDRAQQLEAATIAPWAPTVNEWRHMQGLPPLEDKEAGDLHAVGNTFAFEPIELAPPPPPIQLPPTPGLPIPPAAPGAAPPKPPKPAPKPPAEEDAGGKRRRALSFGDENLATIALARGPWPAALQAATDAAIDAGDEGLAQAIAKGDAAHDGHPAGAQAARLGPALARALVTCWADHAARISLTALRDAIGPAGVHGDVVALLDYDGLNAAQADAVVPQLVRAYTRGVEIGVATVQTAVARKPRRRAPAIEGTLTSPHAAAAAWARAHAADLALLSADQKQRVKELVDEAVTTGITPDELARLLRDTVGLTAAQATAVEHFRARLIAAGIAAEAVAARVARYARAQRTYRAQTIARTELMGALNGGQQALWLEAVTRGVLQKKDFLKTWIVTDDERLEAECEALGEESVPIDEPFSNGLMTPPAHTNCRCSIGLEDAEE